MKRFAVIFMLVLALMVSAFSINGFAASAEIIDSAEIEAVVNADGTVSVTEKWTVSYITSADKFYRHIDKYSADGSMTLLQKYDSAADFAVKIDGEAAEEQDALNSFTVSENGKAYVVTVHCPSAQTTREYEISYTLHGAIKKQSGEAVFAHMFFGEEFVYTSNNASVTVIFPDNTQQSFKNARVYDTFSVEARADSSLFEKSALVKYSAAAETVSRAGAAVVKALPVAAAVILAVVIAFAVLFGQRFNRIPREKAVKRLMKNAPADAVYAMPEGISACEAYKMLCPVSTVKPAASARKVPYLFAMAILECAEKGFIVTENDKLIIGTPEAEIPAYLMSTLNFLKTLATRENDRYVIDAEFAKRVNAECSARYDVVTNYLASFYSLINGVSASFFRKENNKDIYEKAYALKLSASKMKHKPAFAGCMENVLAGGKATDYANFAMLFAASADKTFAKSGNEGIAALCDALSAMSRVYTKSK